MISNQLNVAAAVFLLATTTSANKSSSCSKYSTNGWHHGTYLAQLSTSFSSNGIQWEWYECADECARSKDCEFWTLRLTQGKECLLMKDKGVYHDTGDHIEGSKEPGCINYKEEVILRHKQGLGLDVKKKSRKLLGQRAESTIYLLVPVNTNNGGHGHGPDEYPNQIDPAAGWFDTGEEYTGSRNLGNLRLWTKTVSTMTELHHTTHLGWGYVYLASGNFWIKDTTENQGCGPTKVVNANENTEYCCDRNYLFGDGMKDFFDKYGRELTVIQDVHDPDDFTWSNTKFVKLKPKSVNPCIDTEAAGVSLSLKGSHLVANNLGGQGPNDGDEPTIHYANIGQYRGRTLDLVLSVKAGTYRTDANWRNGYRCESDPNADCQTGHFGKLTLKGQNEVLLNVAVVDHETSEPVVLPALKFSVFDIDQSSANNQEEVVAVTRYKYSLYDNGEEREASFEENVLGLHNFCDEAINEGSNCLVATSTEQASNSSCDNPWNPDDLGEVTCDGEQLNQLKRSFQVDFEYTSSFDFYLKSDASARSGFQFMLGTAKWDEICDEVIRPELLPFPITR